jgi:hypothetical protein
VNLTDQQKDLLQLLVSKHESNGGQPFLFVQSHSGAGLCYPGGDSLPAANDELDFQQLQRENLIILNPAGRNLWRGKPSDRGITAVKTGFSVQVNGNFNASAKWSIPLSKIPPPRKPLGGIEDPPVYTVRIPSIGTDDYPSDFDDAERDKIKAAELRATRVIGEKHSSIRSQAEGDSLLVHDWILPIFVAFSKLACKRVEEGTWPIHKADVESREFTKLLAVSAGMNSPQAWMGGGGPIIRGEIWNEIENSPEWKGHQEKLLDLIDVPNKVVTETEGEIAALRPATTKVPDASSEDLPTVADIEAALNRGDRKKAVALRCRLENDCKIKDLWVSAFAGRTASESTKLSAFNRWQALREDTPSWADELMRKRLLQ